MWDIQKGFAEADYIFENVYRTNPMHQSSIEPHACLAEYDLNGKLTVWTGTQQLSVCHSELSKALGLPQTQVRVIPVWLGGGFGGKLKSLFEPITALLAKATNAPVKLELTREEEFTVTHPRANFTIRICENALGADFYGMWIHFDFRGHVYYTVLDACDSDRWHHFHFCAAKMCLAT